MNFIKLESGVWLNLDHVHAIRGIACPPAVATAYTASGSTELSAKDLGIIEPIIRQSEAIGFRMGFSQQEQDTIRMSVERSKQHLSEAAQLAKINADTARKSESLRKMEEQLPLVEKMGEAHGLEANRIMVEAFTMGDAVKPTCQPDHIVKAISESESKPTRRKPLMFP